MFYFIILVIFQIAKISNLQRKLKKCSLWVFLNNNLLKKLV